MCGSFGIENSLCIKYLKGIIHIVHPTKSCSVNDLEIVSRQVKCVQNSMADQM